MEDGFWNGVGASLPPATWTDKIFTDKKKLPSHVRPRLSIRDFEMGLESRGQSRRRASGWGRRSKERAVPSHQGTALRREKGWIAGSSLLSAIEGRESGNKFTASTRCENAPPAKKNRGKSHIGSEVSEGRSRRGGENLVDLAPKRVEGRASKK